MSSYRSLVRPVPPEALREYHAINREQRRATLVNVQRPKKKEGGHQTHPP